MYCNSAHRFRIKRTFDEGTYQKVIDLVLVPLAPARETAESLRRDYLRAIFIMPKYWVEPSARCRIIFSDSYTYVLRSAQKFVFQLTGNERGMLHNSSDL